MMYEKRITTHFQLSVHQKDSSVQQTLKINLKKVTKDMK